MHIHTFDEHKTLPTLASDEQQTDIAAPVESVKEAVNKLGGTVDWKTRKMQYEEVELEKMEEEILKYKKEAEVAKGANDSVLNELDNKKRLIEELKLNLKRAQHDSELATQRVEADNASVTTSQEISVAQTNYSSAVAELKSVKDELEKLQVEYSSLVKEMEFATKRSEEAVSESLEAEKKLKALKLELIATKESLDSAHAAHLEAEEERIKAVIAQTQDSSIWEKELEKAQEELHKLNQQFESVYEVKLKLEQATTLLLNLKAELQAYKEGTSNEEKNGISSPQRELKELRQKIENSTTHLNYLKVASVSLKSELVREKLATSNIKQREESTLNTVALLEAELNKTMLKLESIHVEEDVKENTVEVPNQFVSLAREELSKAEKEVDLVKASAYTIDRKLYAAQKETEAARASERLALAAVKTLEESEGKASKGVTLSLKEYQALSKSSHGVEERAKLKVEAAISQVQEAKLSELRCLERLEEVNIMKAAKQEELRIAMEKAVNAEDENLEIEHELGKPQTRNEHRRKSGDVGSSRRRRSINERKSLDNTAATHVSASPENVTLSNEMETDSSSETEVLKKKKKKKPLFPQIVTFLARKKVQATKIM